MSPEMSAIIPRRLRVRRRALVLMQGFYRNTMIHFGDVKPEIADIFVAMANVLEPELG